MRDFQPEVRFAGELNLYRCGSANALFLEKIDDFGCLEADNHDRPQWVYSVEKLLNSTAFLRS